MVHAVVAVVPARHNQLHPAGLVLGHAKYARELLIPGVLHISMQRRPKRHLHNPASCVTKETGSNCFCEM